MPKATVTPIRSPKDLQRAEQLEQALRRASAIADLISALGLAHQTDEQTFPLLRNDTLHLAAEMIQDELDRAQGLATAAPDAAA